MWVVCGTAKVVTSQGQGHTQENMADKTTFRNHRKKLTDIWLLLFLTAYSPHLGMYSGILLFGLDYIH